MIILKKAFHWPQLFTRKIKLTDPIMQETIGNRFKRRAILIALHEGKQKK